MKKQIARIARKVRLSLSSPLPLYGQLTFSQEGEDIALARLFDGRKKGFYIDVGAHHPMRFSNTHLFYLRGWNGINIDPGQDFMKRFAADRPRDINLNIGVSNQSRPLTYHEFNEPALNGFDPKLAAKYATLENCRLIGTRQVETQPLRDILEKHLRKDQPIDFLSIDVEGLDLQVVQSNDWEKFRPEAVVAELDDEFVTGDISLSPLIQFMRDVGYSPLCKLVKSVILVEERTRRRLRA